MTAPAAEVREPHHTHEVKNQPPPLENYNAFIENRPLVEAVKREGGGWIHDRAAQLGALAGSHEVIQWGFDANEFKPQLETHDRFGHRLDEVRFHPAWHHLMRTGVEYGLHALPWRTKEKGGHVARAALFMTLTTAEAGFGCPISMTYSGVAALRADPQVAAEWEPRLTSTEYDPRLLPASQKTGALCGMAMTEKQGGSDVRANSTTAAPIGEGAYLLKGHKWFCSAPMCDAFLTLAQAPGGLTCFLVPRFLPDGTKNRFFLQRLKDKLGNRSNASSEIEYDDTWARRIGEEGRGVPTIIEMVNHTRLDCVLGSATIMRQGVAQATHHAAYRAAFGRTLIDQPLMQNVLADLCVESEAATLTALRLARAYDSAKENAQEAAFRRVATAVSKYWVCKRAPVHAGEALECLGSNGYVEPSGLPRLYREAPVNSVWEGSGNVICLDVLRAMIKSPDSVEAYLVEVDAAARTERRLAVFVDHLKKDFTDLEGIESRARRLVEKMALALQGALLVQHGDPATAEAFVGSRLEGDWGHAFGTLPARTDFQKIIDRHRPRLA
jgi:putative acyl-CoA dehydrogenase